jgi:hypothetical protein
MTLDGEVGSTARADVAMAVMLGVRLPDVVLVADRFDSHTVGYLSQEMALQYREALGDSIGRCSAKVAASS